MWRSGCLFSGLLQLDTTTFWQPCLSFSRHLTSSYEYLVCAFYTGITPGGRLVSANLDPGVGGSTPPGPRFSLVSAFQLGRPPSPEFAPGTHPSGFRCCSREADNSFVVRNRVHDLYSRNQAVVAISSSRSTASDQNWSEPQP